MAKSLPEKPEKKGLKKTPEKAKIPPRTLKAAGKKEKKAPKPAPVRQKAERKSAAPRGSRVSFICSECYEEFNLNGTQMKETITCPECLHVGKRPDEDFLRTVNLHKGGERKSLAIAILAGGLLAATVVGLLAVNLPYFQDALAAGMRENVILGGGGLALILFGPACWMIVRYENNRWAVYF